MKEYVLWGNKTNDALNEQVLLSCHTMEQCKRVIELAKKDGFVRFRTVLLTNEKPDFVACINH
jgi:hypothetical protein